MSASQTYHGQCHCGAVRFTAHTALDGMMDCNCSRCRRLGWILQPVAAGDFALLSGEDMLVPYHFNTDRIDHLFCRHCGIESFARGEDGNGQAMVMINVNCLENAPAVDRNGIKHWDGANY